MTWLPGDLLFFTGTDWTARVIRAATAYPLRVIGPVFGPSHVGIIVPDGKQSLLVESTTLAKSPCLLNGRRVAGAQAHVPEERIAEYLTAGGSVAVYRLADDERLTADEIVVLHHVATRMVFDGLPYDLGEALLSGTRWLRWFAPQADSHSLYCSELCARILRRLGKIDRDRSAWLSPHALQRRVVIEGAYERVWAWYPHNLDALLNEGEFQ